MSLPRFRPYSSTRGIALIIVMLAVVALGILAGGFAYSMKVETTLARNSNMDNDMEWLGRSGVELAKYILAAGSGPTPMAVDCLKQKWAGGQCDTNSPAADIPLDHYQLGPGSISVKIVDLDRKFNINTLTPADMRILQQALMLVGVDAAEGQDIGNAILDWMDPTGRPRMGSHGTETAYYMSLNPPYRAKNGPIDDLTEMMLIHGITPAMFYGSGHAGDIRGTLHRQAGARGSHWEEPSYPVGFVDLFCTLSGGLININTASATVLQIIPEVDENIAQQIIMARNGPDGAEGTCDDMPFMSIQEIFGRVPGLPPGLMPAFARYFTTRSTTFEVNVDAEIGGYRRHYVAVLRKDGALIRTLFMYWN